MEELIELLIRAIARWLSSGTPTQRSAPPPIRPGGPVPPPNYQQPPLPQSRPQSLPQSRSGSAAGRPRPVAGPSPFAPRQTTPQQSTVPRNAPPPPITGRSPLARLPQARPPQARRPVNMPPVMVADPIVTEIVSKPGTTAPITKPLAASVTAVKKSEKAKSIRSWMTPDTLRKQYILTELLQPPVAMREPK